MKFPGFKHPITGVVVPLSALRSEESLGIGDFSDLVKLGRWSSDVGFSSRRLTGIIG